jgi:23S rRNA (uracil1939-C5)-methyltransferase
MIIGMIAKGDLVELEVASAAYEGVAVSRLEDFVIFVKGAVPGDRVRARLIKKKKNYAEAVVEQVLVPSPDRVSPRCAHFGTCGGCTWQHLRYERQLFWKREQVKEILQRLAGLDSVEVPAVLASPEPYFYRNKMEFSFGPNRWLSAEEIESGLPVDKHFAVGLHVKQRFDKVLDIRECHLQLPVTPLILNRTRELALARGWSPYDEREQTGYLRNLIIRTSRYTGEVMVCIVTSRPDEARMRELAGVLRDACPEISSIVNIVNSSRSPVAAGPETVLYGAGSITERIGDIQFLISPTSFFQPNTVQAERLYAVVRDFSRLQGTETVCDLYCGIGSISLFLAGRVRKVIGIESQPQAVRDAEKNASANGIANCLFLSADASVIREASLWREHGRPDVVVLDPPRAGMHQKVTEALAGLRPSRIVYVSCNPATQARDLKLLSHLYQVRAVQPVDMFPQTYHIENVVLLETQGIPG